MLLTIISKLKMVDLIERGKALIACFPDHEKCAICSTELEVQGHHIYPRHLGGPEDGPLIHLCSLHHLMVHRLSGKNNTIPNEFNATQVKLIKILVRFINEAKIQFENLDPTWIDRKLMFTVPDALLKRAHKRKQDLGYRNMADYLTHLIVKDTSNL
ncbi:MAG: hypothetical protein KGH75_04870 [Rhodospirillales bacterium]|nr:hypothetical protein [Rhodospirillales bacterium]